MEEYTIQQVVTLLDAEVTKAYEEYLSWHRELEAYADQKLDTEEKVSRVNEILANIQMKFRDIWPMLHMVTGRNDFANNVIKEYNAFIERLKQSGAKDTELPEIKPFGPEA
jgi:hypothetical protein